MNKYILHKNIFQDLGIVSITKAVTKKTGLLILSVKFFPPEITLYPYKSSNPPCMEYCYHFWDSASNCYLDMLVHHQNAACPSLFYEYYLGKCSLGLTKMPLCYFQGNTAYHSNKFKLHELSFSIPLCYNHIYDLQFFPQKAKLWNCLPIEFLKI